MRTLVVWAVVATLLCAGLAVYDIFHAGQFETAQPALKEITANGQRLFISTECAPAPPR